MATRLCPICLAQLDPRTVHWRDRAGNRAPGPPGRSRLMDRLQSRVLGKPDTTPHSWAEWYARGFQAYCPAHQGPLPEDLFTRDLIVIGLVGESGSSKTHYLASLLHLLSTGVLTAYDIIVDFDPITVRRYQNELYRRLFVDRQVIPASRPLQWMDDIGQPEVREPMSLVLRNATTGKATSLFIFDAAGEQLLSAQAQSTWARHLSIANGLLFFVDPSVLPGVRSQLGDAAAGAGQTLHVTESVLDITSQLVRRARSLSPDADLGDVPAALLLTKADLLTDTAGFPTHVLEPLDHLNEAPYRLHNRLHQESLEIEQYISDNGGLNLVSSAVHKFPGITFHAVSATGNAPVDAQFAAVEPKRCLEPFLAVLSRTGLLESGRYADA